MCAQTDSSGAGCGRCAQARSSRGPPGGSGGPHSHRGLPSHLTPRTSPASLHRLSLAQSVSTTQTREPCTGGEGGTAAIGTREPGLTAPEHLACLRVFTTLPAPHPPLAHHHPLPHTSSCVPALSHTAPLALPRGQRTRAWGTLTDECAARGAEACDALHPYSQPHRTLSDRRPMLTGTRASARKLPRHPPHCRATRTLQGASNIARGPRLRGSRYLSSLCPPPLGSSRTRGRQTPTPHRSALHGFPPPATPPSLSIPHKRTAGLHAIAAARSAQPMPRSFSRSCRRHSWARQLASFSSDSTSIAAVN